MHLIIRKGGKNECVRPRSARSSHPENKSNSLHLSTFRSHTLRSSRCPYQLTAFTPLGYRRLHLPHRSEADCPPVTNGTAGEERVAERHTVNLQLNACHQSAAVPSSSLRKVKCSKMETFISCQMQRVPIIRFMNQLAANVSRLQVVMSAVK